MDKIRKNNLRTFFSVFCFLSIFLILLILTSMVVIPKSNNESSGIKNHITMGFYGEPDNSIDVLMVGSSNAYCGFLPMKIWKEYGYSSYVCGEPFQTIDEAYILIKKFLKTQSPRLIIIETSGVFRFNGLDAFIGNKVEQVFPVANYHNRWKTLSPDDFSDINYNWKGPTKGYYLSRDCKPYVGGEYMIPTDKEEKMVKTNKLFLNKIESLCKNNNIKLLFTCIPSITEWNYERHNSIVKYVEEHNIPFVDYNMGQNGCIIDWQHDTLDGGCHLNFTGAQKLTDCLGKYLNTNYSLTDHRNDEAYSAWNEDLQNYEEMANS